MKEFNLLEGYPTPEMPRVVGKNLRSITSRLIASRRDKEFLDGDRNNGYGGFIYDGRWVSVASRINELYLKSPNTKFLQINCEKGFLLHDITNLNNLTQVFGTETSPYAIQESLKSIKANVIQADPTGLPFEDNFFDYVVAVGTIYTLTLVDALKALAEIVRVSKGNSFITLATYETEEEYFLFKDWTLLGTLMFKKNEWIEILKSVNYEGHYYFTSSSSLNLIRK